MLLFSGVEKARTEAFYARRFPRVPPPVAWSTFEAPAPPSSKPVHLRDEFAEWLAAPGASDCMTPAPRKFVLLQMQLAGGRLGLAKRDQRRGTPPTPLSSNGSRQTKLTR